MSYVVHYENGIFVGAFNDIHGALAYRHKHHDSSKLAVTKEPLYRQQFLKPVQEKVTGRMLEFISSKQL